MESRRDMYNSKEKYLKKKNYIIISNLNLIKNSYHILKNINLNIKPTGITFILGPNGSGKTQLARCLHGLEKIEGSIKFNNIELSREIMQKQSFVFQYPVILKRSVLDNLTFFAKSRNIKNYKDKCKELLKFVKLEKCIKKPAMTLSGGEKQRLSLARALTIDPDVLFLDESTTHLDPISLSIIEMSLRKINNNGTKIIFISHNLDQVKRLADEVIFIHKGKVCEQSKKNDFFIKPKSKYATLYLQGSILT